MKINNNNFNVYSNEPIIDEKQKKIYKLAALFFIIFTIVFVVLTIIFPFVYSIIVGYVVGSIISVLLFYFLNKFIKESYYQDYKKAVKKIHLMHQIIYILTFVALSVIFRNYYVVIGVALGLLLIKFSIIFSKER